MRIVLLFAILTLIFSPAGAQSQRPGNETSPTEQPEWTTLSDAAYQVAYPTDWDVDTSGLMNTDFLFFSPVVNASDLFRENVSLMVQDLTGFNLDLKKYTEISEEQIKVMITDSKILLSEPVSNGNIKHHKLIYTGNQGIYELKFEQYFWVIEEKAYVLTFTTEAHEFEKYKKQGEQILDSFTFTEVMMK